MLAAVREILMINCPPELASRIPAAPEACAELLRKGRMRLDTVAMSLTRDYLRQTLRDDSVRFQLRGSCLPAFLRSILGPAVVYWQLVSPKHVF